MTAALWQLYGRSASRRRLKASFSSMLKPLLSLGVRDDWGRTVSFVALDCPDVAEEGLLLCFPLVVDRSDLPGDSSLRGPLTFRTFLSRSECRSCFGCSDDRVESPVIGSRLNPLSRLVPLRSSLLRSWDVGADALVAGARELVVPF